jgi:hypothetical protein
VKIEVYVIQSFENVLKFKYWYLRIVLTKRNDVKDEIMKKDKL